MMLEKKRGRGKTLKSKRANNVEVEEGKESEEEDNAKNDEEGKKKWDEDKKDDEEGEEDSGDNNEEEGGGGHQVQDNEASWSNGSPSKTFSMDINIGGGSSQGGGTS